MEWYKTLLLVELGLVPVVLISLLFVTAPYGRHTRLGWGPVMNGRTAWVLMELPAVITIAMVFAFSPKDVSIYNLVFLLIWEFHYLYRTFYFPFKLKKVKKDFPVLIVLFAVGFNVLNGSLNGLYLFHIRPIEDITFFWNPHFILGLLTFAIGFIIHYTSDKTILGLRNNSTKRYSIPEGGLFNKITNPNYFGEFIQWTGWAILTWSLAGFAFALFTLANLLPRAISNHRWYKEQFEDYPKERKIFLPGIF